MTCKIRNVLNAKWVAPKYGIPSLQKDLWNPSRTSQIGTHTLSKRSAEFAEGDH